MRKFKRNLCKHSSVTTASLEVARMDTIRKAATYVTTSLIEDGNAADQYRSPLLYTSNVTANTTSVTVYKNDINGACGDSCFSRNLMKHEGNTNDANSIKFSLKDGDEYLLDVPVLALDKILKRHGITPGYEELPVDGSIQETIFRYRVFFTTQSLSYTALGFGLSKRDAKQSAARALIEKLTGIDMPKQEFNPAFVNIKNEQCEMPLIDDCIKMLQSNTIYPIGDPICSLQEMCMSHHWPLPTYELESDTGLPHARLFVVACIVLGYRENGQGTNKKTAKKTAAFNMWIHLNQNIGEMHQTAKSLYGETGANINADNPVGCLQEMCVARCWPLPVYLLENESGLPHDRVFTIVCTVLNIREFGQGKNKKGAKRVAASKMWLRLNNASASVNFHVTQNFELEPPAGGNLYE